MVTAFYVVHNVEEWTTSLRGLVIGLAAGGMLVTDAFLGLIALVSLTIVGLPLAFRDPRARLSMVMAVGAILTIACSAVLLGVFPLGQRALQPALHSLAKIAPIYLIVELGPLFLLGLAGAYAVARGRVSSEERGLLVLLVVSLLFAFAVMTPVEPHIALRKGLKLVQIPLTALTGLALLGLASSPRRRPLSAACGIMTAAAVITVMTDTALYLGVVETRDPPPTHVAHAKMEMYRWIAENTPRNAILQLANPGAIFGDFTPMQLESLAERRTFYGNDEMPPMFQVPGPTIEDRKQHIVALFGARKGDAMARALNGFPAMYLFVDRAADGPLDALDELRDAGNLREVKRIGDVGLVHYPGGAEDGR
jgi:hypothetical protein